MYSFADESDDTVTLTPLNYFPMEQISPEIILFGLTLKFCSCYRPATCKQTVVVKALMLNQHMSE